jgi:hypothetical protein
VRTIIGENDEDFQFTLFDLGFTICNPMSQRSN